MPTFSHHFILEYTESVLSLPREFRKRTKQELLQTDLVLDTENSQVFIRTIKTIGSKNIRIPQITGRTTASLHLLLGSTTFGHEAILTSHIQTVCWKLAKEKQGYQHKRK
jgi:hypothetical protein